MARSRVLVTGGAGFLGSHVCHALLDRGHEVTCYDIVDPGLVNPATPARLTERGARLVEGDVLHPVTLGAAMAGHDAVVHAAAISSVDHSLRSPVKAIEVNVTGTLNVFQAARSAGVRRVHYVSTDEVWGQIAEGVFTEDSPTHPRNPYAAGKAGGEAIAVAWGSAFGMHVTITNACNTYGPYQKPDKLVSRTIVRVLRGELPVILGDGRHVREWLYVEDHAAAIVLVLEDGAAAASYCVGSGERLSALRMVRLILEHCGAADRDLHFLADRVSNDRRYALDSSKLRGLGWTPSHDVHKGLSATLEWYQNNVWWWKHFVDG